MDGNLAAVATGKVYRVKHVLLSHKLALMRPTYDEIGKVVTTVSTDKFRRLMHEASLIMGVEVTRNLPSIDKRKPVIVTILRGGLGMTEAMLELMPAARVGHIGLHRDSQQMKVIQYLVALPDLVGRTCIIVDPVIGTGTVACQAISILKDAFSRSEDKGFSNRDIRYVCLIAAPQGIERVRELHQDVNIYFAEQADGLDEHLHIIPSWGDASNKLFGLKET